MGIVDCVYATQGWGVHDDRWLGVLRRIGRSPAVVSLGRDVATAAELRDAVLAAAAGGQPVLAGPLTPVARELSTLPLRLVGLSWAEDLGTAGAEGAAPDWLAGLGGLIVDSAAGHEAAVRAGLEPSRVTVLPWGVDLGVFAFHGPWVDAFLLGVPPHAQLLLSLAPHEPGSRIADIARALAAVRRPADAHEDFPDPYLIVAGSGSQTPELRALMVDLGIAARVRFIGSVPEAELVPLLGRAACYVTASESSGPTVTLLEAMACGTPVVASATPAHLGWVDDTVTGFSFPVGDAPALTLVLEQVLATYPTEVVLRARHLVEEEADWDANVGRLAHALDAVCSSPPSRGT